MHLSSALTPGPIPTGKHARISTVAHPPIGEREPICLDGLEPWYGTIDLELLALRVLFPGKPADELHPRALTGLDLASSIYPVELLLLQAVVVLDLEVWIERQEA